MIRLKRSKECMPEPYLFESRVSTTMLDQNL